MTDDADMIRRRLRTPRAATPAGILTWSLLINSQLLIWLSIPSNRLKPAREAIPDSKALAIALNLAPFVGIAFLCFIAVVRDRIGDFEDCFYGAMMFISAAIAGAMIALLASTPDSVATSVAYLLGRAEVYWTSPVFGTKVAGVFMMSTSTIFVCTAVAARWLAVTGYVFAVMLLVRVGRFYWVAAIFLFWVLLISGCILVQNRRSWAARREASAAAQG